MNETIVLKCDGTGKIEMNVAKHERSFSTPNYKGENFNKLYNDMKEGDIIEITFRNIRICSQCGKKLEE